MSNWHINKVNIFEEGEYGPGNRLQRILLSPAESITVLVEPGAYNIQVEDEDGDTYSIRDVEIDLDGFTWVITLDQLDEFCYKFEIGEGIYPIEIHNALDDRTIDYINVDLSINAWSNNRFDGERLIPNQVFAIWVDPGVYDIMVEDERGDYYSFWSINIDQEGFFCEIDLSKIDFAELDHIRQEDLYTIAREAFIAWGINGDLYLPQAIARIRQNTSYAAAITAGRTSRLARTLNEFRLKCILSEEEGCFMVGSEAWDVSARLPVGTIASELSSGEIGSSQQLANRISRTVYNGDIWDDLSSNKRRIVAQIQTHFFSQSPWGQVDLDEVQRVLRFELLRAVQAYRSISTIDTGVREGWYGTAFNDDQREAIRAHYLTGAQIDPLLRASFEGLWATPSAGGWNREDATNLLLAEGTTEIRTGIEDIWTNLRSAGADVGNYRSFARNIINEDYRWDLSNIGSEDSDIARLVKSYTSDHYLSQYELRSLIIESLEVMGVIEL